MNQIVFLFLGLIITVIGALPFGLVNLSVLNISYNEGISKSMRVAYGATVIELVFVGISVLFGAIISSFINSNPVVNYIVIGVVGLTGIYLFFKSEKDKKRTQYNTSGFYKGMILNAISLQVLLYWLLAVSFIYANDFVLNTAFNVTTFLVGVVIGKLGILYLYAIFSKKVMARSKVISNNINRIIGIILMISVIIQLYRL